MALNGMMRGPKRAGASPSLSRRRFLSVSSSLLLAGCIRPADSPPHDAIAWGKQGHRDGEFLQPRAVAAYRGWVYVIDKSGRIQVFTRDGDFVSSWTMPEYENGTPTDIGFSRDGRVLVPDTHYSRIVEFTPEGDLVRMWGEYGHGPGKFIYPTGIVESPHRLLFISEYGEDAEHVQVYDSERNFLRTWGQHGEAPGEFNRAMAIDMSPSHIVYVADTANHRIQCFNPTGHLISVLGGAGTAPGKLKFPHDIALAPDGSLVVCEYGNNRLSRFDRDGRFVAAFGRPGRALGQFNAPRGVAVSDEGDVFVADTDNYRVQRFRLEDVV